MPGQTEGRKDREDGQTLCHRTLPATAGDPKLTSKLPVVTLEIINKK